jgi:hypothetical protein
MNTLLHDLRHGFRRLRRSPGFAAVLVLALAVGIGTDAALLRLLDAHALRSHPVRSGERLVDAAMRESGGVLATLGIRPVPEWSTSPVGGRTTCVHVAVIGLHTTVSFRLARQSSEIGVRVALGDGGGEPCA